MTQLTDAQILCNIADLQAKKKRLTDLLALMPFKTPTFFFYGKDGTFISLDQSLTPFDLAIEMGILLEASADYLQNQIIEQSNLLK